MTFFKNLAAALIFRDLSITAMAAERRSGRAVLFLSAGAVCFLLIRKTVYRELLGSTPAAADGFHLAAFDWSVAVALLRVLLFLLLIYVPAIAALSGSISGRVRGLAISADSCRALVSALFPLWGAAFFIAAPVQLLVPHFVVAAPVAVSAGMLVLLVLWLAYGIRGIREIGELSTARAAAVLLLSSLALPAVYLLAGFLLGFPWLALLS